MRRYVLPGIVVGALLAVVVWTGDLRWLLGLLPLMADTGFATGAPEAVRRWAEELWLELPEAVMMSAYMQEDVNAIIEVKKELEAEAGERVDFTLARQLSGAGITGDNTLEGFEEQITFYSDSVTIDQRRNAVRLTGRMSEKRTAFSQRRTAKQLLKDWLADLIDDHIFTQLSTSPSAGRVAYAGSASSTATLASGDYYNLALVTRAKTIARKAVPQIFPVRVEGGEYFVNIIAPDCLHDLKTYDATWSQAQREAQERGNSNPLFSGAEGIWDGVVIRSCTRVALATNWGAGGTLPGAENLFLGRQAGVFAWGMKPNWVEQSFDYGNKTGFSIGAIFQAKKAVFNAVDNGVITVRTFRSNIS